MTGYNALLKAYMTAAAPVAHIGDGWAICGANKKGKVTENHPMKRYRGFGSVEHFKDERPYRMCKRCLRIMSVRRGENVKEMASRSEGGREKENE